MSQFQSSLKSWSQASTHTSFVSSQHFRAHSSSPAPSEQKLEHDALLKGITFLAGLSTSPHSPNLWLLSLCKAFCLRAVVGRKMMQPEGGRDVGGEAVEQGKCLCSPQVCWQSEIMRCSWEEKCHCTISQSSSVSFRAIQMPGHPTESPNK